MKNIFKSFMIASFFFHEFIIFVLYNKAINQTSLHKTFFIFSHYNSPDRFAIRTVMFKRQKEADACEVNPKV